MKHYPYEQWLCYVKDELDEQTRAEVESHLYTCDLCLEQYLQALEDHESSLPTLSNETNFTELVMAEVAKDSRTDGKQAEIKPAASAKKPFYQQAAFHYLLAAAATLLLTFSGVFQSLATFASAVETPQERNETVTDNLIDKTFAWMDSLEKKEANKK